MEIITSDWPCAKLCRKPMKLWVIELTARRSITGLSEEISRG
jgi:hypothetical protein